MAILKHGSHSGNLSLVFEIRFLLKIDKADDSCDSRRILCIAVGYFAGAAPHAGFTLL